MLLKLGFWCIWQSDRFIPNRGSTDFEVARYMVTPKGKRSNNAPDTPSKALYKKELAATLLNDINIVEKKSRILGFKKIAPAPPDPLQSLYAESAVCLPSAYRFIPQSADTILDSPGLVDDYYLNLLDWSVNNVVSIGLGNTAYLWNASNNSISQLVNVDEENGPITSLSWAPDGRHIAVGSVTN